MRWLLRFFFTNFPGNKEWTALWNNSGNAVYGGRYFKGADDSVGFIQFTFSDLAGIITQDWQLFLTALIFIRNVFISENSWNRDKLLGKWELLIWWRNMRINCVNNKNRQVRIWSSVLSVYRIDPLFHLLVAYCCCSLLDRGVQFLDLGRCHQKLLLFF